MAKVWLNLDLTKIRINLDLVKSRMIPDLAEIRINPDFHLFKSGFFIVLPDFDENCFINFDLPNFRTEPLDGAQKNYQCTKCEKSFVQRASFRRHDREVHQAHLTHQCQFCEMQFTRKEHLKRHVNKKHAEQFSAYYAGTK